MVGEYLRRLQQGLCRTLRIALQPVVLPGRLGVWGRSGMLAAVGVAVQNWVTCHGAFLNVNPSMARLASSIRLPKAAARGRGDASVACSPSGGCPLE